MEEFLRSRKWLVIPRTYSVQKIVKNIYINTELPDL